MITPPKQSYNLNMGCFATVSSPRFTSVDRTMTAMADSIPISHCTRPSSVPSAAVALRHRREAVGFLSTRNTSPLSEVPLRSPSLDCNEDPFNTYALATPPASCGQQTLPLLNSGCRVLQSLDTSVLQSRFPYSPTCFVDTLVSSSPLSSHPKSSLPPDALTASSQPAMNQLIVGCVTTDIATAGALSNNLSGSAVDQRPSPEFEKPSSNTTESSCSSHLLHYEADSAPPRHSVSMNPQTSFVIPYPDLTTDPDGSSRLDLPSNVIVPERISDTGQRTDPFHNLLSDVLITLVDATGRILYHRCHFSSTLFGLFKRFPSDGTCWRDHVSGLDRRAWDTHFTEALNEGTRWAHHRNATINTRSKSGNEDPNVPQLGSSRLLIDGPVYRAYLGERWFIVHTFSLPVHSTKPEESVDQSYTSSAFVRLNSTGLLYEPLIVHYHSLIRECESDKDVVAGPFSTVSSKTQGDSTTLAWSSSTPAVVGSASPCLVSPSTCVQPAYSSGLLLDGIKTPTSCPETGSPVFPRILPRSAAGVLVPPASSAPSLKASYTSVPIRSTIGNSEWMPSPLCPTSTPPSTTPSLRSLPESASNTSSPIITECSLSLVQSFSFQSAANRRETTVASQACMLQNESGQCTTHHRPDQPTQAQHLRQQPQSYQPHHHHHHVHHHMHPANEPNQTVHHHHHHHHHHQSQMTLASVPVGHLHHYHAHHYNPGSPTVSHSQQLTKSNSNTPFPQVEKANGNPSDQSSGSGVHHEAINAMNNGQCRPATGLQGLGSMSSVAVSVPELLMGGAVGDSRGNMRQELNPKPGSGESKPHSSSGRGQTLELSVNGHLNQFQRQKVISQEKLIESDKDQYGERIMRLQNLLPPQAIQRIRLIWQEIYGSSKSTPGGGIITHTAVSPIAKSTVSASSSNSSLRDHFARRVRQVVRQYLGPNALITSNGSNSDRRSTPDAPSDPLNGQTKSGPLQAINALLPANSAHAAQLSQVLTPQEHTISTTNLRTMGRVPPINAIDQALLSCDRAHSRFPVVTNDITNTSGGNTITATTHTTATISQASVSGFQSTFPARNISQEPKASLVSTSTVITTPGSSCGVSSSLSTVSSSISNPQPAPTLDPQPPPNRRSSNSSQCCVLEWLLSDEADLCLLPPSFYETKFSTADPGPSTDGAVFSDRAVRSMNSNPLTVQLPICTSNPGTSGAVLVSPVTPVGSTPTGVMVEHSPSETTNGFETDPLPASATRSGTYTTSVYSSSSSSGTSPITNSSPLQHRPGSLLVRLLHPTTPSTIVQNSDGRMSQTQIGLEPTSPDVSLVRMDSVPRCSSENSMGTSFPFYQTSSLSDVCSQEGSNPSTSFSPCQPSPIPSTLLNSSDTRCNSYTAGSSPTNRVKRRRSGPPTPLLNARPNTSSGRVAGPQTTMCAISKTTSTTRTRHVSHMDEMRSRITTPVDHPEGLSSPTVTSLTQLLLQDFPTTTTVRAILPTSVNSTSSVIKDPHCILPRTSIELEQIPGCNSSSITSSAPISISAACVSNVSRLQIEPGSSAAPAVILVDSYPGSSSLSADPTVMKSATDLNTPDHMMSKKLGFSASTIVVGSPDLTPTPHSPSSKLVPSTVGHASAVSSFSGVQSSLCRLLLDPQLGPSESSAPRTPSPAAITQGRSRQPSSNHVNCKAVPKPIGIDVYDFTAANMSVSDSSGLKMRESPTTNRSNFGNVSSLPPSDSSSIDAQHGEMHIRLRDSPVINQFSMAKTDNVNSTPSTVLSEEVEFLYEILRRDELERSRDQNGHTKSMDDWPSLAKRSRLEKSCMNSELGSDDLRTSDTTDSSWQAADDVQAVERIREQLQEGFICGKLADDVNLPINSLSTESTLDVDSRSELNAANPSVIDIKEVGSPIDASMNTCFALRDHEIGCVIHHTSSPSSSSGSVPGTTRSSSVRGVPNEGAVAAARASQQAAATQRSKAANQRLLIEQRKRLIEHQIHNQFTVYSAIPNCPQPVNNELIAGDTLTSACSSVHSIPEASVVSRSTRQASGSNVSNVKVHSRVRHASSSMVNAYPKGGNLCTSPSLFVHGLQLTATTVVSISTSQGPALSSRSVLSTYYQHRPEDLPRYLKEVGPNVRVQLSVPPVIVMSSSQTPTVPVSSNTIVTSHSIVDACALVSPNATSEVSSQIPSSAIGCSGGNSSVHHLSPIFDKGSTHASPCSLPTHERNVVASTSSTQPCPESYIENSQSENNGSISDSCHQSTTFASIDNNRMEPSGSQRRPSKSGNSNPAKRRNNSARFTSNARDTPLNASSPTTILPTRLHNSAESEVHAQMVSFAPGQSVHGPVHYTEPMPCWTSVSNVSVVSSDIRSTSNGEHYILDRGSNAKNMLCTTVLNLERPPGSHTTHHTQPHSEVLLVHSEPSTRIHPSFPTSSGASTLCTRSNPNNLSQSTAYVYSLAASDHDTVPSHLSVLPTDENCVVARSITTAQPLYVIHNQPLSSPIFTVQTNSTLDSATATSQASTLHMVENSVATGNGRMVPDLLLTSNPNPVDSVYELDTKPEDSLLPDDIINDVFGLETMVAAKHHQDTQNPNIFVDPTTHSLGFVRYSPTMTAESEVIMDLHGLPSTASSSPSPCSPQLSNTLAPEVRSSCLSP